MGNCGTYRFYYVPCSCSSLLVVEEKEDVVKIFASVSTLADYIQAARD